MAIPGRNIDLGQVSAGSISSLPAYYRIHHLRVPDLIRKGCFKFLLTGKREKEVIPLVKWQSLAKPKDVGGWRLINIYLFGKALVAKTLEDYIKSRDVESSNSSKVY
jgi:hypothetical protein